MGRRFVSFFSMEFSGLHQAAFLLSLASFASQILGLFRDRLLASVFGASSTLDVYYTAFRIPDLIFVFVGSFLSVTVLIPILIEKGRRDDVASEKRFMDSLFSFFILIMAPILLATFFLAPWLSSWLAPGFTLAEQAELVIAMRILLLSPLFLGLSNLFGSVTQAKRRFMVFALSPILYNLGIIIGIVFLFPVFGLTGLVYGVVLGALLHMIIQVPTIVAGGLFPSLFSAFNFEDIKLVVYRSLPRTLGLGALQLAITFLVSRASYMADGSISVFNFAYNLQSVPISLIGISYSVAAFPLLSRFNAEGKRESFLGCVETGVRHILFWILPLVSLIIVLRAQIVRVILGSGYFSWSDTRLTAACLALFALGIAFQSVVLLFDRSYYARQITKVPVITNLFGSATIVIGALVLPQIFLSFPGLFSTMANALKVSDVVGKEVLILPLAYSIGAIANFMLEWVYFRRDFAVGLLGNISKTLRQVLLTSVVVAMVAYVTLLVFARYFNLHTFVGIFLQGALGGLIGILAGAFILKLINNQEFNELTSSFKKKFGLAGITIPNQEQL